MAIYMVKYKLVGEDKERTTQGYKRATPYYKTKGAAKSGWTWHIYWHPDIISKLEYVRIVTIELKEIDSEYLITKEE